MISIDPKLKVNEATAHDIAKKDLIHLVKGRKLVLLADLDHTLIHTTNENVNPDLQVCIFEHFLGFFFPKCLLTHYVAIDYLITTYCCNFN